MLSNVLALIALSVTPTVAQLPGLPLPVPATSTTSPYGFAIKQINSLDTAPIIFEGQRLFVIAAPAAAPNVAIPPIVERVDTINDNLRRIAPVGPGLGLSSAASRFDAKTFKVEIGSENGYPTLYARDAAKHDVAPIMTLTDADATLNGLSKDELAKQWQVVLQTVLGHSVLAAEPQYLDAQLRKIPFVLGGALITTLLVLLLRRWLRRRYNELDAAAERLDPQDTSDSAHAKRLRIRKTIVSATLWSLNWVVLSLWTLVVLWILSVLPASRALANELTNRLVWVVFIWLGFALLDRILNVAIVRVADTWESNIFIAADERARMTVRRPTFVRAAENLKSILLATVAVIVTLSVLSVSAVSVLTIGAVIAFALSFAMQSLIKDYLNGFLILAEDQFAIGDVVGINGFSGNVEDLTLRITRVRTDDGRLVTIPNSTITAVENYTRLWSRIDYRIAVSASSEIDRALDALKGALDAVAADPHWRSKVVEAPQVLGVDSISHEGIVLRAWIKTKPLQRAAVTREINRRVSAAFRDASIALGVPQSVVTQTTATPASADVTEKK